MGHGARFKAAAHLQCNTGHGAGDAQAGDGHRAFAQARVHAAGDHADLLVALPQGVAGLGRAYALEQHTGDLETLLTAQAQVFLGATEGLFAG